MKQLIVFLILFTSTITFAEETDGDCDCTPPGLPPTEELNFLSNLTYKLDDNFVKNMASELCGVLQRTMTTAGYPVAEALERNLLRYIGITKKDQNYKKKLVTFWNHYNDRMICQAAGGFYPEQHIFKRAIDMSIHRTVLTEFFFQNANDFPINVNVTETLPDGRKVTVIDYIDAALDMDEAEDRYNVDEVEDLRGFLVKKHGALTYQELERKLLASNSVVTKDS